MQAMKIVPEGTRVNSKKPIQGDSTFCNISYFEGFITNLFLPWLVEEIPDRSWQTLQERLSSIIKKIIINGRI